MMKRNLVSAAVAMACLTLTGCDALKDDDENIAPVFTSGTTFQVDEGSSMATGYTAQATDADGDSITYELGGDDAAQFSLDAATGALTFVNAPDFEAPTDGNSDNVYKIEITATDGNDSFITQAVTITVGNVFENIEPEFESGTSISVAENNMDTGYTALATDANVVAGEGQGDELDAITYSITGGADQAQFSIDPATGALSFVQKPDFETPTDADADNVCEVEITAADKYNGSDSIMLSVTITDVEEAPANVAPEFTSEASVSAVQGQTATGYTATATDANFDTVTFSLSGGEDQAVFSIDADTGVLSFVAAPSFANPTDANGDNSYLVQISASDGKESSTLDLAVNVQNPLTLSAVIAFPTQNANLGGGVTATTATGLITAESPIDVEHIDSVMVNGVSATLEDIGDEVRWTASVTTTDTAGTPMAIDVVLAASNLAEVAEPNASVSVFNETLAITTLPRTTGVVYEAATGKLYLNDRGPTHRIADVDLATGGYTVISRTAYNIMEEDGVTVKEEVANIGNGLAVTQPHDMILDGNGFAYQVDFKAQLQDGKNKDKQLYKVDLSTGDRSAIGPTVRRLESLELFQGKLLVTAYDKNTIDGVEHQMGLYTVELNDTADPMDDTLAPYSVSEDGTGEKWYRPQSLITNEDDSEILVVDRKKFSLYKVDVNNGNARTVVSGQIGSTKEIVGSGPDFLWPIDLAYKDSDNVFVIDEKQKALMLVNLTTGDRSIVSGGKDVDVGTGPKFVKPERITLDLKGNRAFIADSDAALSSSGGAAGTLFVVDLTTGDRAIVIDQAALATPAP